MHPITVLNDAGVHNGAIELGVSSALLRDRVDRGENFIVKGIFPESELRAIRRDFAARYNATEPCLLEYRWKQRNHWRIDNRPPRSSIPKTLALYFEFTWNDGHPGFNRIARMLAALRNDIAGLEPEFGFREKDDYWVLPVMQHHPRGGGGINAHSDPRKPDGCVISLLMSKRGVDFQSGGVFVEHNGETLDVEGFMGAGDLLIFRPDTIHGVAPIDPADELRFDTDDGRWRMAAVLNPAVR